MKVLVVPTAANAVAAYRLTHALEVLRQTEQSIDIVEASEIPLVLEPETQKVIRVGKIDCDAIVLQLPMVLWMPDAIKDLRDRGINVIVEVDDDYEALHPTHSSYWKARRELVHYRYLRQCCFEASLVTCSTPALLKVYAPHGRGIVLRNYVKRELTEIPRVGSGDTIGWAGSTRVHPQDLQVVGDGLRQIIAETKGKFLSVGGSENARNLLGLQDVPYELVKWVDFDLYPYLLSRFDVGIVPLADNRFNAAKSWLKGLEYAAVGAPFVASDVTEYVALRKHGLGRLALPRTRDWRRELRPLMDRETRAEVSAEGRRIVREKLTIEDNAWRWAEAWASVGRRKAALPHVFVTSLS